MVCDRRLGLTEEWDSLRGVRGGLTLGIGKQKGGKCRMEKSITKTTFIYCSIFPGERFDI